MSLVPIETIKHLWPRDDSHVPGLVEAIAGGDEWFQKFGIDTPLVVAHFMAQISHECGAGETMVENLNYRAEALRAQWPSHFTEAQAEAMAHDQKAIANQAYNGRMGNRPGTNDGWDYRGRGGSQLTGRESYEKLGTHLGLDLLNHPELVIDPMYFMQVSCGDFDMCGCLPWAKKDDVVAVTKKLNGGTIGLSHREAWLVTWKRALGV